MFLEPDEVRAVRERFGTPCYVYDEATLTAAAERALAFPNAFGLTVRYAMKANPSWAILDLFRRQGLHVDASSEFEVERALRAGFAPGAIQLTSQAPPKAPAALAARGVLVNACSLHQLEAFGRAVPGGTCAVRINPGLGSGATNRTNTGGPAASFGIWHEYLGRVRETAAKHGLHLARLHTHIGSGSDPAVWTRVAQLSLEIAAQLPEVSVLNLGGGFKVGRMPGEATTDLQTIGEPVRRELVAFRERHGRALHLEIEPGTYLVANAGAVVATCIDVVDTGAGGYVFAKLDAGMPEVTRPALYGAQHPVTVVAEAARPPADVVFVGPCCESGDVLTPAPGDPEGLAPRAVARPHVGDPVVIGGAGAYCAAMATINYNSYPQAPEVMRRRDGSFALLRRRQTLDEMLATEVRP